MKLLHITATHLNPTGGVPVVLKNLVEEQNKIEGFAAKVLSLTASINCMNSIYFDVLNGMTLKKYIENFGPNVVILHSFFYTAYNDVVKILTKMNVPYFIEPHGSFGKAAMSKSHLKKAIANNTIFRKQIKCAKGFIFLNNSEKLDSVYRTQNDMIIPNGINIANIQATKKEDVSPIMYYIGRYDINHKGLDYLFLALEILESQNKNYKISFWGSGDKKSVYFLKEKASKFKNIHIDINGALFGDDKDEKLEMLGPMLLTSRYEGFPMTVLEAWNYGNPCLVTPGTNVFDEVRNNALGWSVDLNAQSIADGIELAIKEYVNNRNAYVKRCKNYVLTHYTWDIIAQQSLEQIQKVVGQD